VLWQFEALGGVSSPVVADRVVYVGDDAGVLYALR
jgi:outer membrane protein assembly factor BamB